MDASVMGMLSHICLSQQAITVPRYLTDIKSIYSKASEFQWREPEADRTLTALMSSGNSYTDYLPAWRVLNSSGL